MRVAKWLVARRPLVVHRLPEIRIIAISDGFIPQASSSNYIARVVWPMHHVVANLLVSGHTSLHVYRPNVM